MESAAPSTRTRRRGAAFDAQRGDILGAVRRLHAEGGYAAVTMRSVAQTVGLAPMSLYRYFPNKRALLAGVWEDVLREALGAARTRLSRAATGDAAARLRAYYNGYIDFWLRRPDAYWLIFDVREQATRQTFASGPAADFRHEVQALIDGCLPGTLATRARLQAYDLCRCKIIGYLFIAIGMVNKGHTALRTLRDAVLDDIERQLAAAAAGPR